MILDEFIANNNGKKIDFDGAFGAQCVDLYRFYLQDVLNTPQTPSVVGAYQIFDNAPDDKFLKIKNTPAGIPLKGDIMIWDKSYGGFGHVGVITEANVNTFKAFEQNDPINSACQIKEYTYKQVIGWIRFKSVIVSPQIVELKKVERVDLIIKIT